MVRTTLIQASRRDVNPYLQILRNFLYDKHPWNQQLRWTDDMIPKDQPKPRLPDGPAHALSKNHYLTRDNRRAYNPDVVILEEQKKLPSGSQETKGSSVNVSESSFGVQPGSQYLPSWKSMPTEYWEPTESSFVQFQGILKKK